MCSVGCNSQDNMGLFGMATAASCAHGTVGVGYAAAAEQAQWPRGPDTFTHDNVSGCCPSGDPPPAMSIDDRSVRPSPAPAMLASAAPSLSYLRTCSISPVCLPCGLRCWIWLKQFYLLFVPITTTSVSNQSCIKFMCSNKRLIV